MFHRKIGPAKTSDLRQGEGVTDLMKHGKGGEGGGSFIFKFLLNLEQNIQYPNKASLSQL